jgi:cation:H+ antiporter
MSLEFLYQLIFLFAGIVILVQGGAWAVRVLIALAHFLNISEYVLSFVLMSLATTLPELFIGITSAVSGEPLLSLANAVGSNIVNLSFILGIVVVGAGMFKVSEISSRDAWLTFLLAASPVALLLDGTLSRLESAILIGLFIFYLNRLVEWRAFFRHERPDDLGGNRIFSLGAFLKNILKFSAAAGLLIVGAALTTYGAKNLIENFGLSETILGFFVIAVGTSLPELTFALRASLFRHEQLSLGNLVGASVVNSTLVLGLTGVIAPFRIAHPAEFWIGGITMIIVLFLANIFLRSRKVLTRKEGIALVFVYLVFILLQVIL